MEIEELKHKIIMLLYEKLELRAERDKLAIENNALANAIRENDLKKRESDDIMAEVFSWDNLVECIKRLADAEKKRGTSIYGQHTSIEQATMVLQEELEEAMEELEEVTELYRKMWKNVRKKEYKELKENANRLEQRLENATAESVQALAMTSKLINYIDNNIL